MYSLLIFVVLFKQYNFFKGRKLFCYSNCYMCAFVRLYVSRNIRRIILKRKRKLNNRNKLYNTFLKSSLYELKEK